MILIIRVSIKFYKQIQSNAASFPTTKMFAANFPHTNRNAMVLNKATVKASKIINLSCGVEQWFSTFLLPRTI